MINKTVAETRWGPVVIVWSQSAKGPELIRIFLSDPAVTAVRKAKKFFPDAKAVSRDGIDKVLSSLIACCEGVGPDFACDISDIPGYSDFRKRVLSFDRNIRRGRVTTYGRIAEKMGAVFSSRAVGLALVYNPLPLIIPCHRVICSDGFPGGYQGGEKMKRFLLESEGVRFDGSGRVMKDYVC